MVDSGAAAAAAGRVEEHMHLCSLGQVAERGHHPVEVDADAGHFRFRDVGIRTERSDEIADLLGQDLGQMRFHHDHEQRLVDAAVLKQRAETIRPFGIREPKSPAAVARLTGRFPSRSVVRLLERLNGPAPIDDVVSALTRAPDAAFSSRPGYCR